MFKKSADADQLAALNKSLAVIHFRPDGTIEKANENFLSVLGYRLDEIQGKHHSLFVDPDYAKSLDYEDFWKNLRQGNFDSREYKRFAKGGKEVWIQASYNPILNKKGEVYQVVKYATDITARKLLNAESEGKIKAIGKSQGVIEFDLDGTILDANENFLSVVNYSLDEIKGKHHSLFIDPEHANSTEYKNFWLELKRGTFDTGEYKRFGKGGKEIWIQASYNPIFDMSGRPFKVVKYATEITKAKLATAEFSCQLDAISKSQGIIQFNLDGTIITANNNFLDAVGYRLEEIVGKHHQMFVDRDHARSEEYREFWARLREGHFESKVYKRIHKTGREIWIQASYNPIFDMSGRPYKVVKYASDLTELMKAADLADETNSNTQNVASAVEEMSASISEINRNMNLSTESVSNIVGKTTNSSAAASELVNRMEQMGGIVELIHNIAGQVNLLALNATIEAARAGDAGKGFAVVANEVKNLASQTTQATDKIAEQIHAVRNVSETVASGVIDIASDAGQLGRYITDSANAIDEQSSAIKEISSRTQQTSNAVAEIADRIKNLSSGS